MREELAVRLFEVWTYAIESWYVPSTKLVMPAGTVDTTMAGLKFIMLILNEPTLLWNSDMLKYRTKCACGYSG
jgi:hypothetical protein